MTGFGIPGESTGSGSGEAFLGRIQFDTRVGFWQIFKRVQNSDGSWGDEASEPFRNPTMLMDFGSVEAGYINFSSPPQFLLVPYGQAYPQQPQEMRTDDNGKTTRAFKPGFRIKVANPKLFGDSEPYYFSQNSITAMKVMGELLDLVMAAPEFATGKLPLVEVTGTTTVDYGRAKVHAPTFVIKSWHARPDFFGDRTVSAPGGHALSSGNGASRPAVAAAPARQAAQPARQSVQQRAAQLPQQPVGGGMGGVDDDDLNDTIPFGPCWQ